MKFTNLSILLNLKPPPTPQLGIIPIINGQNFTWVSIRMNKFWGKNRRIPKMGFDWCCWKGLFPCISEVDEQTLLLMQNGTMRDKWFLQIERGSMRERERERKRERAYWSRHEVCTGRLRAFFFFFNFIYIYIYIYIFFLKKVGSWNDERSMCIGFCLD